MNVDNENHFEVDSNFEDRDANSFELDLSILLTRTESMTLDNLNDPSLSGPPPIRYRTSSFKALSPPEPPICCIFLCRCLLYVTLLPYHAAHLCLSWCPLVDRLLRIFDLRSPWRQNTHLLDAQLQLDTSIAESRQASGWETTFFNVAIARIHHCHHTIRCIIQFMKLMIKYLWPTLSCKYTERCLWLTICRDYRGWRVEDTLCTASLVRLNHF